MLPVDCRPSIGPWVKISPAGSDLDRPINIRDIESNFRFISFLFSMVIASFELGVVGKRVHICHWMGFVDKVFLLDGWPEIDNVGHRVGKRIPHFIFLEI
jgi:hypothetical protein